MELCKPRPHEKSGIIGFAIAILFALLVLPRKTKRESGRTHEKSGTIKKNEKKEKKHVWLRSRYLFFWFLFIFLFFFCFFARMCVCVCVCQPLFQRGRAGECGMIVGPHSTKLPGLAYCVMREFFRLLQAG